MAFSRLFAIANPAKGLYVTSQVKESCDRAVIRRLIALELTNDSLLYTLPCQGKLDRSRHAGSLPVRQYAYERHDIILKGVIGRRRAPTMSHVSLSKDHGDNGAHGSAPQKRGPDGEAAYLNFADTSRKGYLFLPETAMTASSFFRTMRSQNTTSFRTCKKS